MKKEIFRQKVGQDEKKQESFVYFFLFDFCNILYIVYHENLYFIIYYLTCLSGFTEFAIYNKNDVL